MFTKIERIDDTQGSVGGRQLQKHTNSNELRWCDNTVLHQFKAVLIYFLGHLGAAGQALSTELTYYPPYKADMAKLIANRSLFTHPADRDQH